MSNRVIAGLLAIVGLLMLLIGCAYTPPVTEENLSGGIEVQNRTTTPTPSVGVIEPVNTPRTTQSPTPTVSPTSTPDTGVSVKEIPTMKVREGETVRFPNLQARDPDGDVITYTFSPPLSANGTWVTKTGDAGQYKVKITASDGKSIVDQEVLISRKATKLRLILKCPIGTATRPQ